MTASGARGWRVVRSRASLTWLAGFEAHTVENIAAVITRARQTQEGGQ
jgi:hypothetical protein